MRKEFSESIKKYAAANKKVVFLTGDLGFMALENVRSAIKKRFINVGVCEQNMISLAAGLASEGLTPICYSIAPFAVFRPSEQIRLDVGLHNMNVKIVGNGGGYGYGVMGPTHHAIEDIAVISSFQNMKCYIPFCNEDVPEIVIQMMRHNGPSYLRLGFGPRPNGLKIPKYGPIRKLSSGDSITMVAMGPVVLNAFKAIEKMRNPRNLLDIFVVSEMPLIELSKELKASIKKTKKLIILEEHVQRGGLGENLSMHLLKNGFQCKLEHLHAKGYPNGLYGSQSYHQKISGLDADSIVDKIKGLLVV